MIKVGTRVKVKMKNPSGSELIKLLNSFGGEVIKIYPKGAIGENSCLVAYDVEHLPAIQEANNKHFGTKVTTQLTIVGLNRSLNMPKDKRYYLLAYLTEVTPV